MPHSHHSHSGQFCRHANGKLEGAVQEAIRQGFEVFGLSEHAPRYRLEDLFPEESDMKPEDLEQAYLDFVTEAKRLEEAYSDRISLLIGIETDFITDIDLSRTAKLLESRSEIDYMVGSVHHVNGVSIDFDKSTWIRAVQTVSAGKESTMMIVDPSTHAVSTYPTPEWAALPSMGDIRTFLLAYFDAQYRMLQTHQPEVVGHIDLCFLWTPEISSRQKGMEDVWQKVERNVGFAIGYGALFEANVAAIRKGWQTSYPNPDILQLIVSLGGRICLSDDSHGISYVGLNYLKMRDYLVKEGVETIWYLQPKTTRQEGDQEVGPRGRVVARRMSDWASHPFWKTLESAQAKSK